MHYNQTASKPLNTSVLSADHQMHPIEQTAKNTSQVFDLQRAETHDARRLSSSQLEQERLYI